MFCDHCYREAGCKAEEELSTAEAKTLLDKAVKIEISAGKLSRIAPNFILGALVEATGMQGKSFGKIDIYDKYSTVEVPIADAEFIVDALDNTKINGRKVSVKLCEKQQSDKRDQRYGGSGSSRRGDHHNRRKPQGYERRKRK